MSLAELRFYEAATVPQDPMLNNLLFENALKSVYGATQKGMIGWIQNNLDKTVHYSEENLNMKQRAEQYGLTYNEYQVQTKDGYVLTMVRLRKPKLRRGAPAVMLQHGLLSQADTWTMNERDKAVAWRLVDAGYDVWLGNNRGNKFSEVHRSLSMWENPAAFFNYSFQELG